MIEINNLTESEIDFDLVKQIAGSVLSGEGFSGTAEVSIAFIGPGRMRKLNKSYRKKNRVTDILSFPESKVSFGKFKIGPLEKIQGLGEIVICPREVKKNARKMNVSFDNELKKMIIHGVLHLLDFDHEKDQVEAKKMQEKEIHYLNL